MHSLSFKTSSPTPLWSRFLCVCVFRCFPHVAFNLSHFYAKDLKPLFSRLLWLSKTLTFGSALQTWKCLCSFFLQGLDEREGALIFILCRVINFSPIGSILGYSYYRTPLSIKLFCLGVHTLSKGAVVLAFYRIMSDSTNKDPEASVIRGAVTNPGPTAPAPEGPTDSTFGEQNLSFTTTDLSLVEMTEIEYTQLQHILYSHMEAQANENEAENRLNLNCFSGNNPVNNPQFLSSCNTSQGSVSSNSSGNQSLYPIICQSGLASDNSFMGPNQCLGHIDFQELRMMLLSESNLPLNQIEKTPNGSSVDVTGQSLVKGKHTENVAGINLENSAAGPESRAKSAVRVRLEDRFNSVQTEIPRCQESQETGVAINKCVTFIFLIVLVISITHCHLIHRNKEHRNILLSK